MINEARELSTKIRRKVNSLFPALTLQEAVRQKHCYLCEQTIYRTRPICHECEADLPWNNHHCGVCAVPLPPLISDLHRPTELPCPIGRAPRVCGECLKNPPSYEQCHSAFCYAFPINTLVANFKYNGKRHYGKLLSQLLAEQIANEIKQGAITRPDLLLPVPLHIKRYSQRGFNQSDDICTDLSKRLKIPINHHSIQRVVNTPSQASLNKTERQKNLLSAFRVRQRFNGETIALIDDVITTGATVERLSNQLRHNGAKAVYVWSLARTPLERP